MPFVRRQVKKLRETGELDGGQSARIERMAKSIERGFAAADVHETA
jgi:hypothetical protein